MHGKRSLPILQHVWRWRRSTYQKIKSVAEISKKFIPRVLLNEYSARLKNSITRKKRALPFFFFLIPCPAIRFLSLLTWRHIVSHQDISTNSYIQITRDLCGRWIWGLLCLQFFTQDFIYAKEELILNQTRESPTHCYWTASLFEKKTIFLWFEQYLLEWAIGVPSDSGSLSTSIWETGPFEFRACMHSIFYLAKLLFGIKIELHHFPRPFSPSNPYHLPLFHSLSNSKGSLLFLVVVTTLSLP